ncbi:MAG: hypothetical protein U0174_23145 [Polyangiaceae bacterium]
MLLALAALLSGDSQAEAACRVGVGRATVCRWLADHAGFRQAYREGLESLRSEVSERVNVLAVEALGVVRAILLDPSAPHGARLQAAKVLLDRVAPSAHQEETRDENTVREQVLDKLERLAKAMTEEPTQTKERSDV